MVLEALEEAKWAARTHTGARLAQRRRRWFLGNSRQTVSDDKVTQDSMAACPGSAGENAADDGKLLVGGEDQQVTVSFTESRPCQFPSYPTSAEALAEQLLSDFWKRWLAQEGRRVRPAALGTGLQEFMPSAMATKSNITLAEEIKQKARIRGSLTWAPPRFQIIFNSHPPQKRRVVMDTQQYLCAGCGTKVDDKYIKKLRYCEYLGRYFCDCCHGNATSVIPGRVLDKWDFDRYPVCNFSKQLLDSVWCQPLFNMARVSRTLQPKARELDKFRELQEQLVTIRKVIAACRLASEVQQAFQQIPAHLTREPDLLSLDDLMELKRGRLVPQVRMLLQMAALHVGSCQLCLAHGFICELCRGEDVIFPFQSERCKRCPECRACFHTQCFRKEPCPKCVRIHTRKQQEPEDV